MGASTDLGLEKDNMNKLIRSRMLIFVFALFNCYSLHSEEVDDKLKEIVLNIPEVINDIDNHKVGRNAEFQIMSESEIDLDGNKIPDFIVMARYLDYGGTAMVVIEDIKTLVFWDLSQYFDIPVLIDNIIPNKECMFYRSRSGHGYAVWGSKIVGLWPKPEILLNLDFGSYESAAPSAYSDEDNFKFEDLDGDKLKEVILEHIIWKYKVTTDEGLTPVLSQKEYRLFKYDEKKKQLIEFTDQKILKAAKKCIWMNLFSTRTLAYLQGSRG